MVFGLFSAFSLGVNAGYDTFISIGNYTYGSLSVSLQTSYNQYYVYSTPLQSSATDSFLKYFRQSVSLVVTNNSDTDYLISGIRLPATWTDNQLDLSSVNCSGGLVYRAFNQNLCLEGTSDSIVPAHSSVTFACDIWLTCQLGEGPAYLTSAPLTFTGINSFSYYAIDESGEIVDAINNQTQQEQENHDETMDKIDDATDFDDQEQSDLTGAVDGASEQINEKLGILSFGDHVLDQFIAIFDSAADSPGITLPGFSIEVDGVQHVVWTDQVFDLSTIEDKFGALMTAVHFATSFLVYAALVMYVQKIFGAIMQDWSDK